MSTIKNSIFSCSLLVLLASALLIACGEKEKEEEEISNVLFEEDFSDNSFNWPVGEFDYANMKIENGQYIVETKNEDINYFTQIWLFKEFKERYSIKISMANLEGGDAVIYGIQFFRKDTYNLYNFFINGEYFYIAYTYNYVEHIITDWTKSAAIKPDGQYNTVRIGISDHHMDFFINDTLIHQYDAQFTVGEKFGLQIAGKGKIGFDDLLIYR